MKLSPLESEPQARGTQTRALVTFGAGALALLAVFAAGAVIGRQSRPGDVTDEAPAPAAASTPGERYLVEVAVLDNRSEAERILTQLRRQYTSAWIAADAGGRLFHVYVGPYPNADQANTVRSELADQGMQPVVVKASGTQS